MKKILIAIFVLTHLNSMSQVSYYFKTSFEPDKHFIIETLSNTFVEQDYIGDSAELNEIKKNGIKLPIQMKSEYSTSSLLTTKPLLHEDIIPFKLQFTRAHSHNEYYGQVIDKDLPLLNVIALGSFDKEGTIVIDSITQDNKGLSSDSFSSQVKGFIVNIPFPNKPLKVGDKFTQESPIEIPISEIGQAQLILVSTYTLSSVNIGRAIFDISQEIKLNPNIDQLQINANGSGQGKVYYDLNTNVISNYKNIWTIDIKANSSNMTLLSKMQTEYNQAIKLK
jgi:hypothetical protein